MDCVDCAVSAAELVQVATSFDNVSLLMDTMIRIAQSIDCSWIHKDLPQYEPNGDICGRFIASILLDHVARCTGSSIYVVSHPSVTAAQPILLVDEEVVAFEVESWKLIVVTERWLSYDRTGTQASPEIFVKFEMQPIMMIDDWWVSKQ